MPRNFILVGTMLICFLNAVTSIHTEDGSMIGLPLRSRRIDLCFSLLCSVSIPFTLFGSSFLPSPAPFTLPDSRHPQSMCSNLTSSPIHPVASSAADPTNDANSDEGHRIGCFKDKQNRDLPIYKGSCNVMTPKLCNALCRGTTQTNQPNHPISYAS